VARIRFCITESMLGVITGEVGVGKTVAVRAAVSQLHQAAHHIVYLANPTVGIRGLYVTIVRALGAVPRGFKAELIAQAQDLLAAEEHERRRRVVLLVDLCRLRDYADPCRRRRPLADGGDACRSSGGRHNHRLSRKARSGSGAR
jgi:type II secretory pathway predicted ATPase ExeA